MSPSPQPVRALLALNAIVTLAACSSHVGPAVSNLDNRGREELLLSNWKPPNGQRCTIAALPLVLPSVESLLDTITMPSYLAQGGIAAATGSTLFSIKFDSSGTPRRAHAIESTLTDQARDILQTAVASALQPQRPGADWGVRVRIDIVPALQYRVGRGEVCIPAPIEAPSATGNLRRPKAVGERTIEKRVQDVRFNVLIGADGTVLDAKLLAPMDNAEVEEMLQKAVMREHWNPGLDDRIPVAMSAVRTHRIRSEIAIRRAP
jgi:hypothetical protein